MTTKEPASLGEQLRMKILNLLEAPQFGQPITVSREFLQRVSEALAKPINGAAQAGSNVAEIGTTRSLPVAAPPTRPARFDFAMEFLGEPDASELTAYIEQLEAACRAPDGWVLVPAEIADIAERLHTQDNRITQDPLFAVQQKRRIYGMHPDYCGNSEWVLDGETIDVEDEDSPPERARKVGYDDKWEFVTGCLTEQGCKDYIAVNGHNLHEPRIYAYGSYRNAEFIALRKWLMSFARPATAPKEQKP